MPNAEVKDKSVDISDNKKALAAVDLSTVKSIPDLIVILQSIVALLKE